MEDIRKRANKIRVILIVVLIGCFLYLGASLTYTAYESLVDARVKNDVAGISIKINGEDVIGSDGTLDKNVILDNTTWKSTHTREEKISPGSSGTIAMELDPTGSEVAIIYTFKFVDKQIDEDKLLTFSSITSDHTFTRTAEDEYTGIIPISELSEKVNISVDFFFDALTDMEAIEEDNQELDDLFEIHFHAYQYKGEEIVPYNG